MFNSLLKVGTLKCNKNTYMTIYKLIFTLKMFKAEENSLKKRELT